MTRPFVLGRRCPDSQFKQSLARQLRMLLLVTDAEYVDELEDDHPSLYGLFAVNNALHDQEREVPFVPGENQRDFLDRLTESDHKPTEALTGLLSVGVDDMAEAHRRQAREARARKSDTSKRRSERHPRALNVRRLRTAQ